MERIELEPKKSIVVDQNLPLMTKIYQYQFPILINNKYQSY